MFLSLHVSCKIRVTVSSLHYVLLIRHINIPAQTIISFREITNCYTRIPLTIKFRFLDIPLEGTFKFIGSSVVIFYPHIFISFLGISWPIPRNIYLKLASGKHLNIHMHTNFSTLAFLWRFSFHCTLFICIIISFLNHFIFPVPESDEPINKVNYLTRLSEHSFMPIIVYFRCLSLFVLIRSL